MACTIKDIKIILHKLNIVKLRAISLAKLNI